VATVSVTLPFARARGAGIGHRRREQRQPGHPTAMKAARQPNARSSAAEQPTAAPTGIAT
jgi:hypothetical protein